MRVFKPVRIELLLFMIALLFSLFFRIKIIRDLPLGTAVTEYGLEGFDDEPAHYNYVKFLMENNKLPVLKGKITDPDAFEKNEFEYFQPPLYYLMIALPCKWLSIDSQYSIVLFGRIFNLILFIGSLFILFHIFKTIGWEIHKILAALSVYALLGSSVYQNSVFGNDSLSWALLWLIFLLVLRGVAKNWFWLILVITCSHYIKFNIVVFYPVLIWAIIHTVKKSPYTKTWLKSVGIIIIPMILASPWYIRNYCLYGRCFGVETIVGDSWIFVSSLKESLLQLLHMPYTFFFRFYFDPPKKLLSWLNYLHYGWGIFAIIVWVKHMTQKIKRDYYFQCLSLLMISMGIAYIFYAIPSGYTEGRLLYPAMPGILAVLTGCLFIFHLKNRLYYVPNIAVLILLLPSYFIGFF